MRNRLKKQVEDPPTWQQVQLLTEKLDTALLQIASLEKVVALNDKPFDTIPWTFDIQRNSEGKISGVIAQKENTQKFIM